MTGLFLLWCSPQEFSSSPESSGLPLSSLYVVLVLLVLLFHLFAFLSGFSQYVTNCVTMVRLVALYGSECWPVTRKHKKALHVMEM